eukprot:CAMPEP_0197536910 /NCGR_PEP_ID=MMETSP1318-20131121/55310_1 /TAXON_ID=552666 /ORGANISM="Partenskyella glossopodia, Strain RCC365" /LENGTH=163 /DNA_ID=CAMNT_0043094931 /DNA_START=430 /DNA_END=921 /DNA_ORIENTATION=+
MDFQCENCSVRFPYKKSCLAHVMSTHDIRNKTRALELVLRMDPVANETDLPIKQKRQRAPKGFGPDYLDRKTNRGNRGKKNKEKQRAKRSRKEAEKSKRGQKEEPEKLDSVDSTEQRKSKSRRKRRRKTKEAAMPKQAPNRGGDITRGIDDDGGRAMDGHFLG